MNTFTIFDNSVVSLVSLEEKINSFPVFMFIRNIDELIRTAEERGVKFEAEQAITANKSGSLSDRSAKAYYKEFKKVRSGL